MNRYRDWLEQTSFNSVKIISLNRNNLLARLRELAGRIRREHGEVAEIRAFSSLARGDATGMSDAEVLMVLRDSSELDPHRRILTFLPYFDIDRGADILVYTRGELENQLSTNNSFIQRVRGESIVL